jgi:hypothetical protein
VDWEQGAKAMAESPLPSPIICVTCQRSFPDDLDAEKSPRYFAQYSLLPKADDAFDFASEVQSLCRYIKAIADVMSYGDHKEVDQRTYDTIFELVGQLSEEALHRVDLSLEASREIEKRELEAKKAPHARKEGV